MAYCAQADIEDRIGSDRLVGYADHDEDGTADADVVTQAIEHAQGDIDSYLAVKLSVPISPVPDELNKHCVTMAVYYLALGRDSVTDQIRQSYEDVISWLKDVVAGKATLSDSSAATEAEGAAGVRYQSDDRQFERDSFL